ncbi:MAG: carbohydrate ABC transporter permease [Bacteroidetes bacterium]|nr:carbohydrate ABC transporter permease [Bacteroidota bacterium]
MRYLRTAVLLTAASAALMPFLWLLSTSFKGAEELFAYPPTLVPETFVWENYSGVWDAVPLAAYFLNSVIIAVVSVTANVLLASLGGFALARLRFRFRTASFVLVIAAVIIPKEVLILPLYTIVLRLHLADSLAGVLLPFLVDGMSIFLMRQAFLAIPKDVEEAGIMDGASALRLWWNVMLPMTRPAMATVAVVTFIASWGDFLWPLVVLRSPEQYTVQVGLSYLTGTFVDNFRYVAAGSILSIIPVLLVFILLQRHFERGILSGSGK